MLFITRDKAPVGAMKLLGRSLLYMTILVKRLSVRSGSSLSSLNAPPIPVYHAVHVPNRVPNAESVIE